MKAIIHSQYGPPNELMLREIEKPVPKEHEILIKIHATTVTSTDCNIRNFTFVPNLFWLPSRINFGLFKPKIKMLGVDFAGEVEAVGKSVSKFKIGTQLFGSTEPSLGGHAEYICLSEDSPVTTKPENVTWEEAAAITLAGNTALYFLRDLGKLGTNTHLTTKPKILINGASGAIGSFAVQIAKSFGALVIGVCSTSNLELVKSLGADDVIDYTKKDFTELGHSYDIIFDVASKSSFKKCKNSLIEKGIYLATLPNLTVIFQTIRTSLMGGKRVNFGDAVVTTENLEILKQLIEAEKIKPVIDRCYPLEQIPDAFEYVEQGHKKGNVVIEVSK